MSASQASSSGCTSSRDQSRSTSEKMSGANGSRPAEAALEKQPALEHRYLEYDTELPAVVPPANPSQLPPHPDLTKTNNPFDWPDSRKNVLVALSCVATALTAYASGMYASGVPQMSMYFGISDPATYVGITTFTVGFGIAPMVLAPFSELVGRRPIFVTSGLLWVVFQVFCAVTHLYAGMLLARLGAGICSSTFSTMVGGVISDMYRPKDRNTPMTLFTGFVLGGTGLGPLISGFIAQNLDWRWIFWVHLILVGVVMVFVVFFFYESRGSVLLSRRAKALNKYYEQCEAAGSGGVAFATSAGMRAEPIRLRWKVKADEERASISQMVKISLFRPIMMLFTEPIVFFFSLWLTFGWMILYLTFSAIGYVFESGAIFAATTIASAAMTVISIYQNRLVYRLTGKIDLSPEGRLRFPGIWSAFLPIGLFIFGWTAMPSIHWIIPTIFGVALTTVGIFSIYLATFNYLADCYGPLASSAIASQSMCRNLAGGATPIYTDAMYRKLTIGGASSLLGGIAALLTLVPWVLEFYGPRIRAKSKAVQTLRQT